MRLETTTDEETFGTGAQRKESTTGSITTTATTTITTDNNNNNNNNPQGQANLVFWVVRGAQRPVAAAEHVVQLLKLVPQQPRPLVHLAHDPLHLLLAAEPTLARFSAGLAPLRSSLSRAESNRVELRRTRTRVRTSEQQQGTH